VIITFYVNYFQNDEPMTITRDLLGRAHDHSLGVRADNKNK